MFGSLLGWIRDFHCLTILGLWKECSADAEIKTMGGTKNNCIEKEGQHHPGHQSIHSRGTASLRVNRNAKAGFLTPTPKMKT